MRTRAALLLVALLVGSVGATLLYFRHFRYPPLPARLLPDEAEAYLYLDLATVRQAAKIAPGSLFNDPEVAEFTRQTGIAPEQDVNEFALASFPQSPLGGGPVEHRFAEAITGHFDSARLTAFLRAHGTLVHYRDYDLYEVPHEDRIVRVAIVDPHLVVISNTRDATEIRWMLDRYQHISFPRSGPNRVNRQMRKLPLGAIAWAIVRLSSATDYFAIPMPGGLDIKIPRGVDVIASARALTSLELRAETDTTRERSAKKLADEIATYLTLFRAVEITMGTGGPDPDVRKLFDSVRVQQEGSKVIVTAEVPYAFMQKMAREARQTSTEEEQPPAQSREDAQKNGSKRKR